MQVENVLIIDTGDLNGQDLRVECAWDAVRFPLLKKLIDKQQISFVGPVDLKLYLQADQEMVRARGSLKSVVRLECSRCLELFDMAIEQNLELVFQPAALIDIPREEELELTAEQLDLIPFQGSRVDLRKAVAEQVLLALPMKPLCNSRCKGLCSRCGMNLNIGPCNCPPEKPAGPLAGLKVLLSGKA